MATTLIGLNSGLSEGNPFSAWTMNTLGPSAGMLLKELFITAPLCIGGGYICFRMAKEMSLRRKIVLAKSAHLHWRAPARSGDVEQCVGAELVCRRAGLPG